MERQLHIAHLMVARTIKISPAKLALLVLGISSVGAVLVARPSLAKDNSKALEQTAQPLFAAANQWRDQHSEGCPTVGVLVREGLLEADVSRVDPWGGTLRLVCSESDRISVLSPGQDGQLGTDDDLEWPGK